MELETTDMNVMDFINLNTNEILITVMDAQGKRKDYQMNKISKVKELSQSYLADTNQLGKAEAIFNLKGGNLIMTRRLQSRIYLMERHYM